MEHQRLMWIAVLVATAMLALPFNCLATDYTVGDSSQWDVGVNYSAWTSGKTFAVGDKLVFKYTAGAHDVLVVNKAAYDSCLKTNTLATYATGNDAVTLNATGAHYYICGISTHCSLGQKVTVTVAAASTPNSNRTAPSSSPAPSPSRSSATPTTPPAQSPSPSSTTPPAPTSGSPSPSSGTSTPSAPSPSSGTTTPSAPSPSSSTNGASPPNGGGSNPSAAAPSYRMGGSLLLGISLLLAVASL